MMPCVVRLTILSRLCMNPESIMSITLLLYSIVAILGFCLEFAVGVGFRGVFLFDIGSTTGVGWTVTRAGSEAC